MAREKSINELLGGTGSSPVSTVFNAFKEYQSLMEGIEDRSWKNEARRLDVAQGQINAVSGFVTQAEQAAKRGDAKGTNANIKSYDDAVVKMDDMGVFSHRIQMQTVDNKMQTIKGQIDVLEKADKVFDQVLSEKPDATLSFDVLKMIKKGEKITSGEHSGKYEGEVDLDRRLEQGIDLVSKHIESLEGLFPPESPIMQEGQRAKKRLATYKVWRGNDGMLDGHWTQEIYDNYMAGNKDGIMTIEALKTKNDKIVAKSQAQIQRNKNRVDKYMNLHTRLSNLKSGEDPMAAYIGMISDNELAGTLDISTDMQMEDGKTDAENIAIQKQWLRSKIREEETEQQQEEAFLERMMKDQGYADSDYTGYFDADDDVDLQNYYKQIEKYQEKGYGLDLDINLKNRDRHGMATKKNGKPLTTFQIMGMVEELNKGYDAWNQDKIKEEEATKEKEKLKELGKENIEWLEELKSRNVPIKVNSDKLSGEKLKTFRNDWETQEQKYMDLSSVVARGDEVLKEWDQLRVDMQRFKVTDWEEPANKERLEKYKKLLGGKSVKQSSLGQLQRKHYWKEIKPIIKKLPGKYFGGVLKPQNMTAVYKKWEFLREKISQENHSEMKRLIAQLEYDEDTK